MYQLNPTPRRHRYLAKSTGIRVSLKARDQIWLDALAKHGPLDSRQLHAFSRFQKPCLRSALKRLTDLTHETDTPHNGAYLIRPSGQLRRYDAKNRPAVYDLSGTAFKALGREKAEYTRPTGPFEHQYMTSSCTAAVELACIETLHRAYISGQHILDRAGASLGVDMTLENPRTESLERHRLVPDAIFAMEYLVDGKPKYRSFALECDRGTEPVTSKSFARKSYLRSLLQYEVFLSQGLYKNAYGLKCPMKLFYVFNSTSRRKAFDRLVAKLDVSLHVETFVVSDTQDCAEIATAALKL